MPKSNYCAECLKLAKDDCDGTEPRPQKGHRGKVFETDGKRHGLNYCRNYEFNPQHLPPILSNAGSREEFKEKVRLAKAEGKVKKQIEIERKAHERKAAKLQAKLDAAEAMAAEILAEAAAEKEAAANVKPPVVDDDGLPTLGDLGDLLV